MTLQANSKSITIPFFRVGEPPYNDGELKEVINTVQRAIDAQQEDPK